jgi:hypothetical protein
MDIYLIVSNINNVIITYLYLYDYVEENGRFILYELFADGKPMQLRFEGKIEDKNFSIVGYNKLDFEATYLNGFQTDKYTYNGGIISSNPSYGIGFKEGIV